MCHHQWELGHRPKRLFYRLQPQDKATKKHKLALSLQPLVILQEIFTDTIIQFSVAKCEKHSLTFCEICAKYLKQRSYCNHFPIITFVHWIMWLVCIILLPVSNMKDVSCFHLFCINKVTEVIYSCCFVVVFKRDYISYNGEREIKFSPLCHINVHRSQRFKNWTQKRVTWI